MGKVPELLNLAIRVEEKRREEKIGGCLSLESRQTHLRCGALLQEMLAGDILFRGL
jgi:hypothetical protein